MAPGVNTAATFIPDKVFVLMSTTAFTAKPTLAMINTFASARTAPAGFLEIGQTSLDQLPTLTANTDGGDPVLAASGDTIGTTGRSTSYAFGFSPIQVDDTALGFYAGGGVSNSGNSFDFPAIATPLQKSLLQVITTPNGPVAFYFALGSLIGSDSVSLDRTQPIAFPVTATILTKTGSPIVSVIAASVGTA